MTSYLQLCVSLCALSLLCVASLSCGQDTTETRVSQNAPAQIVSFRAGSTRVLAGERTVLSWDVDNAERTVLLARGVWLSSFTKEEARRGSFVVFPTRTTQYTLQSSDTVDGSVAQTSASLVLEVAPNEPKVSILTDISPSVLSLGEEALLSWTTQGASSLSIVSTEGPLDTSSFSVAQGTIRVRPQRDEIYTLRATSPSGDFQETRVEVRVASPPSIDLFRVEPPSIRLGEEATLIWKTTGADRVRIWDEDREIVVLDGAQGQRTLSVSTVRTTRLRLIAERDRLRSEAEVTLEVNPPPTIISFRAEPETILLGQETTLIWDIENEDEVRIWDADNILIPIPTESRASGRLTIAPERSQTYRLEVTSLDRSVTATTTVSVFDPIEIVRFEASQDAILRGQPVTLSWETRGATAVVLRNGSGERLEIPEGFLNGSLDVRPDAYTSYVLEALGPAGRVSQRVEVRVDDRFEIVDFVITPTLIAPGEEAILTWRTTGGARWTLNAFPSSNLPPQQGTQNVGALAVSPNETTVYVFRHFSADGEASVSRSVTLSVSDVVGIVRFDASSQRIFAGQPVVLSWETLNASQVQLVRGGVSENVSPEGSLTIESLNETTTWTLIAQSPNGVVSRTLTVNVEVPVAPEISTFETLEGPMVLMGDAITFHWQTRDAVSAEIVWTDENGELVEVPIATGDLAQPNLPYNDTPVQDTLYRFEVEGVGGTRANAEYHVSVIPQIEIQTFEISPRQGPSGDIYTLSWVVEGATSLTLEQQTGLEVISTPLSAQLPGGSLELPLDETTRFTLHASNPLVSASESLTVTVGDGTPRVDLFEIQPRVLDIDEVPQATLSVRDVSALTLEARDDLGTLLWSREWNEGEHPQGTAFAVDLEPATSPQRVVLSVRGLNGEETTRHIDLSLQTRDPSGVRLSEVLYDVAGEDDGQQWIELRNEGVRAVSLWDVVLGWGGGSFVQWVTPLRGVIRPGECIVVGGPISSELNGHPTFRALLDFSPNLEDADLGARADGLALFASDQLPVDETSVPIDSLVYGDTIAPGDLWGARESPDVSHAPTAQSLVYDSAHDEWFVGHTPTPGLCFGLTPEARPSDPVQTQDPQVLQGRRRGGEFGGEILAFDGFDLGRETFSVLFGTSQATCIQDPSSATPLLCQVPPGTGDVDLTFRTPQGDLVYPAWYTYEPIDRCTLEPPHTLVGSPGDIQVFAGRVLEPGASDDPDVNGALHVQLGIGPFGTDPSYAEDLWTWVDMIPSVLCPDCAEEVRFQTDPIALPGPGSFSFVVRARPRAVTQWTYCDSNGTIYNDLSIPNGFSLDRMGTLFSE